MKYIHNEKEEGDPKLARIMKIQQKQTVPFADRKTIKEHINTANTKETSKHVDEEDRPSIKG
jgi:hypothetical protein